MAVVFTDVRRTGFCCKRSGTDTKLYELRTYYAAEGKLDALLSRFRDHTTKLFAKHA